MNPFVRGTIAVAYTGAAAVRSAVSGLYAYAAAARAAASASTTATRAAQRQRISFMEMMRMMVVFGVGLQIINAMMLPGKWLMWGIKSSMQFEHGMAQVNTVLGVTKQELRALGDASLLVGARMGMTQDKITEGLYNIGQSISAIKLDGMNRATASLELLHESQRLAKTSGVELNIATEGLMRTMASMGFGMKDLREIAGLLFQTINVGIISGDELNRNIGDITSSLSFLITKMSDLEKKNVTKQMLALWSALSQTIPASEAATSVNVFMNSLIKGSDEAVRLMNEFKNMFGVDITMEAFLQKGPLKYFEDLFAVIKDNGPLMQYIQGQIGSLNNLQGNNAKVTAIQVGVLGTLFGNIRALRGVLAAGGDEMRVFNTALGEFANAATAYDKAVAEMMNTAQTKWEQLSAFFQVFSMKTFGPATGPLGGLFGGLANVIEYTLNQFDFEGLSFGQKIKRLLFNMNTALIAWWNTGGKKEWQTVFHSMGFEITNMFISLFTGRGIFGEMGSEAAKAFMGGFKDRLLAMLGSSELWEAANSTAMRAILFMGLFGAKRGLGALAFSEGGGAYFNRTTNGAGEGSGWGDFIGGAGQIALGLAGVGIMSRVGSFLASKGPAALGLLGGGKLAAGAAATKLSAPIAGVGTGILGGLAASIAGLPAAIAGMGTLGGSAFVASAALPGIAAGYLGYRMLGKGIGAPGPWWGIEDIGRWMRGENNQTSQPPTPATHSKTISVNVNIDKIADSINLAEKHQVKKITDAVAKGLTEGLRRAGLDVTVQPVPV